MAMKLAWLSLLVVRHAAADKVQGPVIGIDLGTTFSCAGIYKNGIVEIIPNDQGNRVTPSYVAFTEKERLVGEAAKNQATLNPEQTVFNVKRFIGRSFKEASSKDLPFKVVDSDGHPAVPLRVQGKEKLMTAEEISSMVLAKLKESAEKYLGQVVQHAVITVPAFFSEAQRKATKDAGSLAGLEVLRILNEPTAAALAYGFEKKEQENILVFDLGGGTCDVSLLRVSDGEVFKVLATSGEELGGENFDGKLMEHLIAAFKKKQKKDIASSQQALQRLRLEVEKVKRRLSTVPQAQLKIEGLLDGADFSETVTRAQFEKLNAELFKRTLEPVKRVLNDAGLSKAEVAQVVLAGGSARIPKVQQLLVQFFDGKELVRSINPDEAIAHGAALHAATLSADGLGQEMLLVDVAPLSLGIRTAGGFMTNVISRNTPLPAESTTIFSTNKDDQERVTVKVFEGERLMAKNNHLIGSFEIKGISPAPRGLPQIAVTFKVDANGLLTVEATDRGTGTTGQLAVAEDTGRLTKAEIEQMISDAEAFAEEDQKDGLRAETILKLKAYIRTLRLASEQSANEEDSQKLRALSSEGQDWLAGNPDAETEEIDEKFQELEANAPEFEEPQAQGGAASHEEGGDEGELDMEGHEEL